MRSSQDAEFLQAYQSLPTQRSRGIIFYIAPSFYRLRNWTGGWIFREIIIHLIPIVDEFHHVVIFFSLGAF